jgi:hypothetical protein
VLEGAGLFLRQYDNLAGSLCESLEHGSSLRTGDFRSSNRLYEGRSPTFLGWFCLFGYADDPVSTHVFGRGAAGHE